MKHWTQVSRKKDYENQFFTVYHDRCILPNDEEGDYFVIDPGPGVFIVPVTQDGDFVMVKQVRYPLQKESIEFPAGGREGDENLLDAARRELKEETGVTADSIEHIGQFAVEPGRSVQVLDVVVATGLRFGEPENDPDEDISVIHVSSSEIDQMLSDGTIFDGPTMATWTLYRNHTQK